MILSLCFSRFCLQLISFQRFCSGSPANPMIPEDHHREGIPLSGGTDREHPDRTDREHA